MIHKNLTEILAYIRGVVVEVLVELEAPIRVAGKAADEGTYGQLERGEILFFWETRKVRSSPLSSNGEWGKNRISPRSS